MSPDSPSTPDIAESTKALLDRALSETPIEGRRVAFLELLGSDDWRHVLAPHVISRQAYPAVDGPMPDWLTFRRAARVIALDAEKVDRSLKLAGARFSGALLSALACHMRSQFVEPALAQLVQAEGPRAAMLQRMLQEADPHWLEHDLAIPVVRQEIRERGPGRALLMNWLAQIGALASYTDDLVHAPPRTVEEWAALGKARLVEEALYRYALATLDRSPAAVHYLLRLDPVPDAAIRRIFSGANPDWLASLFEAIIGDPIDSPSLIPLAEIAVQTAGRPMAIANAWIGASKLGRKLLNRFGTLLEEVRSGLVPASTLWSNYEAASGERALDAGRQGQVPDVLDGAALVRQFHGQAARDLVREIVATPRPALVESVLRPLVGTNARAAAVLLALRDDADETIAARAQEFFLWPDIHWPEPAADDTDEEESADRTERLSLNTDVEP